MLTVLGVLSFCCLIQSYVCVCVCARVWKKRMRGKITSTENLRNQRKKAEFGGYYFPVS